MTDVGTRIYRRHYELNHDQGLDHDEALDQVEKELMLTRDPVELAFFREYRLTFERGRKALRDEMLQADFHAELNEGQW